MKRGDYTFGTILALFGGLCLFESHRVWNGWGGTGSMPLIVGSFFCLLVLLFFLFPTPIFSSAGRFHKKEMTSVAFIGGSFALYIGVMHWLGFMLSTWLFLALVTKYMSQGRLLVLIIWTGVVAVCSHIIFKQLLGMYLPAGFLGV
jgi:hypothetical protein